MFGNATTSSTRVGTFAVVIWTQHRRTVVELQNHRHETMSPTMAEVVRLIPTRGGIHEIKKRVLPGLEDEGGLLANGMAVDMKRSVSEGH